ncbi:MAG: YiiD C-terminal domain-containing protein [Dokdonella sp.]
MSLIHAVSLDRIAVGPELIRLHESEMRAKIPLADAMDLRIASCDDESLTMTAPLGPNINDKGCAFGGSLTSLMTLAGWSLVKLAFDARGLSADIYVQDSHVRYLAPVWSDFSVIAHLADGDSFAQFFETFAARGKARLGSVCSVPLASGELAATLTARFVALRAEKS